MMRRMAVATVKSSEGIALLFEDVTHLPAYFIGWLNRYLLSAELKAWEPKPYMLPYIP